MKVEEIHDDPSFDGSEGLLAVVVRIEEAKRYPHGLHFVTAPEAELQVAVMRHVNRHEIQPHYHQPAERKAALRTSEMLFVRSGLVRASIYNSRRVHVASRVLSPGDLIVLVAGGHGFAMLAESELIEVKTGPYAGAADKVRFRPCFPDDYPED